MRTVSGLLCGVVVTVVGIAWLGSFARADEEGAKKEAKSETVAVKIRDIKLEVPKSWKSSPPSNRLRLAQFAIPAVEGDSEAAELVISSFGGSGGGVQANVTRWLGQFQQSQKVKLTTGESTYGKYTFVDITGTYNKPIGPPIQRRSKPTPGSRMLGVILEVKDKGVYFLKMTGPQKTVGSAADALRESFGADAAKEKQFDF